MSEQKEEAKLSSTDKVEVEPVDYIDALLIEDQGVSDQQKS